MWDFRVLLILHYDQTRKIPLTAKVQYYNKKSMDSHFMIYVSDPCSDLIMVEYALKILDDQTKNNILNSEYRPYPYSENSEQLLLQLDPPVICLIILKMTNFMKKN